MSVSRGPRMVDDGCPSIGEGGRRDSFYGSIGAYSASRINSMVCSKTDHDYAAVFR